jgi:protein-disulfide isomerase
MKDEAEVIMLTRPVDEADHAMGPQSAPATLVEYGDYECPYCRQLYPIIKELIKRTEGLRFVYRHFPISKVHPFAMKAAEAAEAASVQGHFWEMHDALFGNENPLDEEHLARSARKAGLNMERYLSEMSTGVYAGKVNEDFNDALFGGGVTGTPTLYLNGQRLNNIHSLEALLEAIIGAGANLRDSSREQTTWISRLRTFRFGKTRLHL